MRILGSGPLFGGSVRNLLILVLIVLSFGASCGSESDTTSTEPPPTVEIIIRSAGTPSDASNPSAATPLPSPTPFASSMPLPTRSNRLIETYVVQWGDTLGSISLAFDVPVEELVALNGLDSESAIIQVGQALQVPLTVSRSAPKIALLPDSEVVFSPAYIEFDTKAFVAQQGGYLASFSALVDGAWISGAEIVTRVARQYSVGPRVLLALLEHYGGWVTQTQPETYQPLGVANPWYEASFFLQLGWAATRVNQGYYDYKRTGQTPVRFHDGGRALVPAGLNAGTAAIQNILAINSDWETWDAERKAFMETFRRLFGDPFARTIDPLVPSNLKQPSLRLPWEAGTIFYYTGGPHAAFGSYSAWAAVDFTPPDIIGSCYYSQKNITAAADGRLFLGQKGELYLDLDADGNLQTGWVLLYLHVVARDDLTQGQIVSAGAPLGYASCEGGISNSSHLHFARRYNGEWMAADGPVPMVLSGWKFQAGVGQYDGTAVRDGVTKTACECSDEIANALVAE